ncbi:MAG: hypothetical protein FJ147_24000 [Deltaproteobacteria bacterium]|nr:hypothetical protein [Deltaproteobacteria bacterium]
MFGFGLILTIERSLNLPERALTVPYRVLILAASLSIIVTVLVKSKRVLLRIYMLPLVVFWLAYGARFIADVYVRELPLAQTPSDLLFYIVGMCVIPMTAMFLHASPRFASVAVLTSLVVLGLTCAAILLFSRDVLFTDFGRLRAEGGLSQITLGHLGVSLTTLSLFLMLSRFPIVQVPRTILTALIVFGLLVVGLASSRGPLVALVVMVPLLVVFAWYQGKKNDHLGDPHRCNAFSSLWNLVSSRHREQHR